MQWSTLGLETVALGPAWFLRQDKLGSPDKICIMSQTCKLTNKHYWRRYGENESPTIRRYRLPNVHEPVAIAVCIDYKKEININGLNTDVS